MELCFSGKYSYMVGIFWHSPHFIVPEYLPRSQIGQKKPHTAQKWRFFYIPTVRS